MEHGLLIMECGVRRIECGGLMLECGGLMLECGEQSTPARWLIGSLEVAICFRSSGPRKELEGTVLSQTGKCSMISATCGV